MCVCVVFFFLIFSIRLTTVCINVNGVICYLCHLNFPTNKPTNGNDKTHPFRSVLRKVLHCCCLSCSSVFLHIDGPFSTFVSPKWNNLLGGKIVIADIGSIKTFHIAMALRCVGCDDDGGKFCWNDNGVAATLHNINWKIFGWTNTIIMWSSK